MSLNLALFAPKHVARSLPKNEHSVSLFQTPSTITQNAIKGDARRVYHEFLVGSVGLSPAELSEHMSKVDDALLKGFTWGIE